MSFANSVILYNCKINHNGLFGCDFGGSGATRDSVMGTSNSLATVKFTYGNCTYMRKDKTITVDENADVLDAAGVNYCRYINTDFSSNHYFYAFVEKIEYVAPQTSRLHIKTDVFMTYFHKIIPNQCFVEREHVADDTPLMNVIPENVGTGELRRIYTHRLLGDYLDSTDSSNWIVAFNVATDPDQLELGSYLGVVSVGGIPSGTQWYGVNQDDVIRFTDYLVDHDATILSISLISIFSSWINDGEDITVHGTTVHVYHLRDTTWAEAGYDGSIAIHPGFNTPGSWTGGPGQVTNCQIILDTYMNEQKNLFHNNKLLCYPYTCFELFTYDGSSVSLVPQDTVSRFMGGAIGYNIKDTMVQGSTPSETAIVAWDSGVSVESFPVATQSFSGFPTISVTQDSYAQFVARNANSLKFQKDITLRDAMRKMNSGFISMGKGVAGENPEAMLNGYYQVTSAGDQVDAIEAKMADQKNAPDSVAGHASDGALFELNRMGVFFGVKRLNDGLLEQIDNYFDRYGYAIKEAKTPQWNSRPNFNYIKTGGANIGGEIPESDKEEINRLLDTGMTIWHNVGTYGQFNGANNLASTR